MRSSMRHGSAALEIFIALLVSTLARPGFGAPVSSSLPSVVLAATGPRIAVVIVSQDAKAAPLQGQLEGAAEDALVRASRFTIVSVQDAFNPDRAKKRAASLENQKKKLNEGKAALDDLDNVKATEAFTQALDGLKEADLSTDFEPLVDAWTMKAAGHATGGEMAPAKKEMEGIIGVAPRTEFSPNFFPPELIKYADAQKRLVANAKGELLVRTEPPGARVWIDGTFRGVSPVTVAGVNASKHFVTATLGGFALAQVQASPGETVLTFTPAELGAAWKKATDDIVKDPEGPTRDTAAASLGRAAQLDQVLVVLAKKSLAGDKLDLIGMRLESRDGHNLSYRASTVTPGDPESLSAFFDGLTGSDAKREGKEAVHHFKTAPGTPIRTIAGYSLLGLGAVGLASGVTFGVLALGNQNAFLNTPQTRIPESMRLASQGRAYSVVADVSFIVAVLSAAAGGILLFTKLGLSSGDESEQDRKARDSKRLEADRKAADDRRAADERAKEDDAQRKEDRRKEDEKRKAAEQKAADDKKAADEAAAKKPEEKKLTRKEREAQEKKQREEEAAAAKKQAEEEAAAKKAADKKAADEAAAKKASEKAASDDAAKKKAADDAAAKKKADDEAAAAASAKKKADSSASAADDAAAKKKAQEDAAAAEKKREEEEKARAAEAERKKKEEAEKKKRDEKKKEEDHDDLRNY